MQLCRLILISFFHPQGGNLLRRTPRGSLDSDSSSSPPVVSVLEKNAKRRRVEDRLALLFMGIVLVFFCCSLPRNLLNFYESIFIEQAHMCSKAKRQ